MAVHSKPQTIINLNGEKLKAIPLKSGTRETCPLSSHLFNIVLEGLARSVRQLKEIKRTQKWEDIKEAVFSDDIITIHN